MNRWIIRSLFLGLLLLFVGGWVWSGTHYAEIIRWRNDAGELHRSTVDISRGGISIEQDIASTGGHEDGWSWSVGSFYREPYEGGTYWPRVGGGDTLTRFFFAREVGACETFTYVVGFRLDRSFDGLPWFEFVVPFWFPTAISTCLLWLVWRKTRPKAKGRAFPVELAKPSVQSSKTE